MEVASKNGDDLSNEQMIALLKDAEKRLRAKQSAAVQNRETILAVKKPVRLEAHNLPKPYVSTKSGVAKLDRSRVQSEEDHKLARSVKKVEDPVVVKEKKLKVGYSQLARKMPLPMRKSNPNL